MSKRDEYTRKQKKKILNREFGKKEYIIDPAGRKITKESAVIDHIIPASKGGKATLQNGQVLHWKTNLEKSNKLSGTIGPQSNQKTFWIDKNPKNPQMIVKNK